MKIPKLRFNCKKMVQAYNYAAESERQFQKNHIKKSEDKKELLEENTYLKISKSKDLDGILKIYSKIYPEGVASELLRKRNINLSTSKINSQNQLKEFKNTNYKINNTKGNIQTPETESKRNVNHNIFNRFHNSLSKEFENKVSTILSFPEYNPQDPSIVFLQDIISRKSKENTQHLQYQYASTNLNREFVDCSEASKLPQNNKKIFLK